MPREELSTNIKAFPGFLPVQRRSLPHIYDVHEALGLNLHPTSVASGAVADAHAYSSPDHRSSALPLEMRERQQKGYSIRGASSQLVLAIMEGKDGKGKAREIQGTNTPQMGKMSRDEGSGRDTRYSGETSLSDSSSGISAYNASRHARNQLFVEEYTPAHPAPSHAPLLHDDEIEQRPWKGHRDHDLDDPNYDCDWLAHERQVLGLGRRRHLFRGSAYSSDTGEPSLLPASSAEPRSSSWLLRRRPRMRACLGPLCKLLPLVMLLVLGNTWFSYRRSQVDNRNQPNAEAVFLQNLDPERLAYLVGPRPAKPWEITVNDPYRIAEIKGPSKEPAPPADVFDVENGFLPKWYPLPGFSTHELARVEELLPIESQAWLTEEEECLEEWIAQGQLCSKLNVTQNAPRDQHTIRLDPPVDILFTWVNGSDPLHQQSRQYHVYCTTSTAPAHDELCPKGVRSQPNGRQELVPESEQELQAKLEKWLQSVWPILLTKQRILPREREYWTERSKQKQIGVAGMRFLEMDELRYAIRTAAKTIPNLRTVHVIAPDFPAWALPGMVAAVSRDTGRSVEDILVEHKATHVRWTATADGSERVGQRPVWLDINSDRVLTGADAEKPSSVGRLADEKGVQLRLHHDWSIYDVAGTQSNNATKILRKHIALPTFNSMAVESVIDPVSLPGLADIALFANDDFFVMRPLSLADIVSPLYGPSLRFQEDLVVHGHDKSVWTRGGEWPGLEMASHLLDERFGKRTRRYPVHIHRAMSRSLLHESRLIWREDLTAAGTARFRGLGMNIVSHYLTFNMIIERHREAMLWIFIMLRLENNGDGVIDADELRTLRSSFAFVNGSTTENVSLVRIPRRRTAALDVVGANHQARGVKPSQTTEYPFVSGDGFPYSDLSRPAVKVWGKVGSGPSQNWNVGGWPHYLPQGDKKPRAEPACQIEWSRCLSDNGTTSEAFFKRVTFYEPRCGDCLITHLVQQSGELGLSAVLPSPDRLLPESNKNKSSMRRGVPHLPLTRKWFYGTQPRERQPDFSVQSVARLSGWSGGGARDFARRLLMRYSYVLGHSPTEFLQLGKGPASKAQLESLSKNGKAVLVCINDDIQDHDHTSVPAFLKHWFKYMFPDNSMRLPFEKT
ncbi:hypothetical protein K437DRAFT_271559 [Tilletiaria anomala UBC 951]|uniref:Stealth protein CR1 conserved region 1 domain-containing protein n=1 Tax=Tilletiaria anomala (strain ATCC 24038 / CBS 436.72 / UBC 951) TaxID=1037660 RepID=A0A066WIH4_TILAU|nr:uncharacterized protein K437DRAFT_271559 [Tilletiaria anomala UBC 951]KDN53646.1 hypothetical protein K437DRAFT_271559 [Tilletiaria anomala UBC 951]